MTRKHELAFWITALLGSAFILFSRMTPSAEISITYELDNGQLVSFVGERSKCIEARDALEADDGSTVTTKSPWGVEHNITRVWCASNGTLIAEGSS